MGKKQKKVSAAVEERRKKKKSTVPLVKKNPFEVRVNRLKHQVLGQKIKTDKGVPGVSRSKSNEKRKKTLLKEYKQRFKNNAIIDKRFGEYDDSLSIEDKMLKRYALEKQRHHEKSDLYNLGDDDDEEMLTHYGQNLGDLANFDDAGLKLTDDEDEDTSDNFGGFLTKKKKTEGKYDDAGEQLSEKKLSKQEIMDQIVANSKKKKFERQQTQERAFELTQHLDSQFNDIVHLLSKKSKANVKEPSADDYDRTVNELFFESKAKASDRLKTEEEIVREEKEKLEELEKERLRRMLGDEDEDEQQEQSADALITKKKKSVDNRMEVHYRDGKIVLPDGHPGLLKSRDNEDEDKNEDKNEEETEDEDSEEDDEDSDHEDIFSDEENGDEEENDEDEETMEQKKVKTSKKSNDTSNKKNKDKGKNILKTSKHQSVEDELPYVFDAPTCLSEFLELTNNRSDKDVLVILNRIRKCHHVKLDAQNKQKIEVVFDVVLKYMDHLCNLPKPKLKLVNHLAEFLDACVVDIPDHVTKTIRTKLKSLFKRIQMRMKSRDQKGVFPTLSELMFFKVISLLYPTSDLNHVLTTPTLVLMAMVLSKGHCVHLKDVVSGIFLLNIVHDYIKLSKRYIPEVISFLSKLLYFSAPTGEHMNKISASILNLRREEHSFLLVDRESTVELSPISLEDCLSTTRDPSSLNTDEFRVCCVRNILLLTKKYANLYRDLSSYNEIFQPCAFLIERLPSNRYPKSVKDLQEEVLSLLKSKLDEEMVPLTMQARKPIPLPLLEPEFDEHYEYRSKSRSGNKEQNELKKLKYKVKNETKGAMREIRKDAHFLAKEQLKEKISRDNARKQKVKDLQRTIENERREIKEMEKKGGL